jgi:hypothetical protein
MNSGMPWGLTTRRKNPTGKGMVKWLNFEVLRARLLWELPRAGVGMFSRCFDPKLKTWGSFRTQAAHI